MTTQEIRLVRESFALAEPKAEVLTLLFNQRLFTTAPSLRLLFGEDVELPGKPLMDALRTILTELDDLDHLGDLLVPMSARERGHGVREWHYENFGEALIWTLQQSLGGRFTPQMLNAWHAVCATVIDLMLHTEPSQDFATACS